MNSATAHPKSKLDCVLVLLVLIQIVYACWEIMWQQYSYQPIAVYLCVLLVLPCYMRGSRWPWAMLFLFSVHILHAAIFLYHNWYYNNDAYPRWLAILQFAASPLCLRVLGSQAKEHSIDWGEFAKVLGAIAITAGLIFIRGEYFPAFACIEFSRPVKRWEYLVDYSGFSLCWTLLVLWCSYSVISVLAWLAWRHFSIHPTEANP
jgi:hypothetical protein